MRTPVDELGIEWDRLLLYALAAFCFLAVAILDAGNGTDAQRIQNGGFACLCLAAIGRELRSATKDRSHPI